MGLTVNVILPATDVRRWHRVVIDRLSGSGHELCLTRASAAGNRTRLLDGFLAVERRILGSADTSLTAPIAGFEFAAADRPCQLTIDLSRGGAHGEGHAPTLSVLFQGQPDLYAAAEALCRGDVPALDLYLDGVPVRHAAPMTYGRSFISRGLDDVVARAITLIASFVDRYQPTAIHRPVPRAQRVIKSAPSAGAKFAASYLTSALPRLASKIVQCLRYHEEHWRTGYRLIEGPGVAETGSLAGTKWSVLPDPGDRYYADPFPFEWEDRLFIFVEEVVHSAAKGVISVSERGPDGRFGVPRAVLEEPYHLSYPQVFARDGNIWMIPESGAEKKVVLYRAQHFPDVWVEHRVIVADREIFDATLLEHDGLCWLLGTERDGAGNASDTMVVFLAERIEGPWRPHPMNPILIDKAAARPGGGFAKIGDRVVLPVQDGTLGYGSGLGIAELLRLDPERVEMSKPKPIDFNGDWPYPHIHTLNRHGRLETIDGIAKVARRHVFGGRGRSAGL